MPFAISSVKYRTMFKEQMIKKLKETKAKEEKKKKKKQTKLQKEKEKIEKSKRYVNKKSQAASTNACKVCHKLTKTSNLVVCNMCLTMFHVKCKLS